MKAFLERYNVAANSRHITNSRAIKASDQRLGVLVATSGDVRDQQKVTDAASEVLQEVFGKDKNPYRLVYGVASLPLATHVELEIIFELAGSVGDVPKATIL